MAFYDKCHMTKSVIKYSNMGIKRTVLIRKNDLWTGKPFPRNEIRHKMQKTKIRTFPFVFLGNSFVSKKSANSQGKTAFSEKVYKTKCS